MSALRLAECIGGDGHLLIGAEVLERDERRQHLGEARRWHAQIGLARPEDLAGVEVDEDPGVGLHLWRAGRHAPTASRSSAAPLAMRMSNHGGEVGTASGVVVAATTRRTGCAWKAAAADPATTATATIASAMRADGGIRRGEGAAIEMHRSPCTLG